MDIKIIGAREHNLKNINVLLPRNKLIVITGVSGSGKSTLAFDIIFTEAQRQYLESLSSYARRLLPKFSAPAVDLIEGLSPCIVIDQSPLGRNPRIHGWDCYRNLYSYQATLFKNGISHIKCGGFFFQQSFRCL